MSAVFAELISEIKRREAWERALAWYGEPVQLGDDERASIDRELLGDAPPKARRKRSIA